MKKIIPFALLIVAFQGCAQSPKLPEILQKQAEQAEVNGFSGSVLVAQNGRILLEKGFGMADREAARRETAETVFSIGSITKQFTAAAILKLESQGKLKLDDRLSTYFPEAPADKSGITLHQLLTHSAGLDETSGDDYDNVDAVQFSKIAFVQPLRHPPGTTYLYSNVGYSLLGIIVEKVSGQGYETFLRENLWLPAGMQRTGYVLPKFEKEQLAVGYRDGKRWGTALDRAWLADGPGWHLRANGGVLSTAHDMYLWYKALKTNSVLPKSATDKIFTPHIAEGPAGKSFYGYGWVVQDFGDQKVIWHNGGNGVYNAFVGFERDGDVCVVVSSNSNNVISDGLALQLYGLVKNPTAPPKAMQVQNDGPGDYRNNPVTDAIYRVLKERGAEYFSKNSQEILKTAGFDFENDMQLLGVGERIEEAKKWNEGVALFEVYTQLFPRIVVAWNRLGVCRKATGDRAGAKSAWEKSVSLRPNGNPAAAWLKEL